jgi:uncharacterized membrane protein
MKNANFIRLLFLIIAVVFSALLFSAPQKREAASESCTEESKEKCDDKKVQTDLLLWESIGRHLLSSR